MSVCPSCKKSLSKEEITTLLYIKSEIECNNCYSKLKINEFYQNLLDCGMASKSIHIFLGEDIPLEAK